MIKCCLRGSVLGNKVLQMSFKAPTAVSTQFKREKNLGPIFSFTVWLHGWEQSVRHFGSEWNISTSTRLIGTNVCTGVPGWQWSYWLWGSRLLIKRLYEVDICGSIHVVTTWPKGPNLNVSILYFMANYMQNFWHSYQSHLMFGANLQMLASWPCHWDQSSNVPEYSLTESFSITVDCLLSLCPSFLLRITI